MGSEVGRSVGPIGPVIPVDVHGERQRRGERSTKSYKRKCVNDIVTEERRGPVFTENRFLCDVHISTKTPKKNPTGNY